MKVFLMGNPKLLNKYARFSHVGTWKKGKLCKKCEQPTSKLIQPLMIEWEPGSSVISNFSWCGYTSVVLSNTGCNLVEKGFDCELGKVEILAPTSKGKKIVAYPYKGPELKWLLPNKRIPLNELKSNVDLLVDCDECKQKKYTFKSEGIFIDKDKWSGEKIFHIEQYNRSDAMFVTEEAMLIIKKADYKNVGFFEAGMIE